MEDEGSALSFRLLFHQDFPAAHDDDAMIASFVFVYVSLRIRPHIPSNPPAHPFEIARASLRIRPLNYFSLRFQPFISPPLAVRIGYSIMNE